MEGRILLGSGGWFEYRDPTSSALTIEDVAYGLAYAGRFAGQCVSKRTGKRVYYSVAEHSVRMSRIVKPKLALHALMHEAGEATCGDMPGPLKPLCPCFKEIETACERAAFERFGVSYIDKAAIKRADLIMLRTELRDLMPRCDEEPWGKNDPKPLSGEIVPWTAEAAAQAFLERFHELTVPDFMREESGSGTECIANEECIWPGEGGVDVLAQLAEGPHQHSKLSHLLLAIIRANPVKNKSDHSRLENACHYLLGEPLTKGRGISNDDKILVEVARAELEMMLGGGQVVPLSKLISDAAWRLYPDLMKTPLNGETLVKRVSRKYPSRRERLLLLINTDQDFEERLRSWNILKELALGLGKLGVKVNLEERMPGARADKMQEKRP